MNKVIGFERLDYVSKKGTNVKGYKVFVAYTSEKIEGVGTTELYVSDNVGYIPKINDVIEVFYNRFQQVAKISILK